MKVKTTVEFKFHNAYCGWSGLEFTDSDENRVEIKMTDEDYLSLADTLQRKAERIREERAELAAEQQRALEAQENENK
jgi:hypothetical protein